ncbi:hypothetical protein [Pseudophaeobacter sp.]|jgi:hypothetical protein|uniref:spike base protein, RCAP_Rcc01079 family n=1 Tax=Pseudophaeobacter sp. TaxID=1971739 RepID=UPI0032D970A5
MPQINPYYGKYGSITAPAVQHFNIVPADGIDLPMRPRVLRILTSGDIAIRDDQGVVITYAVSAGETLQFSAVGVESTGTTATVVGWL